MASAYDGSSRAEGDLAIEKPSLSTAMHVALAAEARPRRFCEGASSCPAVDHVVEVLPRRPLGSWRILRRESARHQNTQRGRRETAWCCPCRNVSTHLISEGTYDATRCWRRRRSKHHEILLGVDRGGSGRVGQLGGGRRGEGERSLLPLGRWRGTRDSKRHDTASKGMTSLTRRPRVSGYCRCKSRIGERFANVRPLGRNLATRRKPH